MKILSYHYKGIDEFDWNFEPIKLDNINLLVGSTASGKSRLLFTIFNLGRFVVKGEVFFGHWDLTFEQDDVRYHWEFKTERRTESPEAGIVTKDNLWRYENGQEVILIERDSESFIFDGERLPKLSLHESAISLLRDEDEIKPVFQGFTLIMRRIFSSDALSRAIEFNPIPDRLTKALEQKKDSSLIMNAELGLSANLYLLSKYFKKYYEIVIGQYKQIFPFVQEAKFRDLSELTTNPTHRIEIRVPVFVIREQNSKQWVSISELSSGMQKVLLILADLFILPNNSIYIIDEYENSLGINAINFFPDFLLDFNKSIQFLITSHHPYIINQIPVKNWYVLHRDGTKVKIKYGEELATQYGQSRQQAFVQLLNDPFYNMYPQ